MAFCIDASVFVLEEVSKMSFLRGYFSEAFTTIGAFVANILATNTQIFFFYLFPSIRNEMSKMSFLRGIIS